MDESKMNFEETVEYVEFMDDFIPEETVHKPLVFFEEKRIVYGNIIEKNLDKKTVRSISRTLGYELYDGQIYDFDTNEVYEQCTLGKNIPEGKSFLVSNRVFKNSNLKIDIETYKKNEDVYLSKYYKILSEILKLDERYYRDLDDEEHIERQKVFLPE